MMNGVYGLDMNGLGRMLLLLLTTKPISANPIPDPSPFLSLLIAADMLLNCLESK
jgi:hypothetical protein